MTTSNGFQPNNSACAASVGDDPVLVCFSHLRWDFVYQRPQHLMTRAARRHRVVFVEEPSFEARDPASDGVEGRLRVTQPHPGVTVVVPVLPAGISSASETRVLRGLITGLIGRLRRHRSDLITWYYTPMAYRYADHLPADVVIYDCMDELSAFKNAPARLPRLERALFARADIVFTGGLSLYEAKQKQHDNVHAFPSSIDVTHFARARERGPEPADQAKIGTPRIGFFGVIDERMDTALLDRLAELRPDWQFVMVGPVVKIDPADLPTRANIHWLGSKTYSELPDYLATWQAGLMPFAINEATRFISPTKTPEFLAAGVPLVSTPVRDVVRPYGEAGLVAIASTADACAAALTDAMARPKAPWLAAVDERLAGMSWDRTWSQMAARVEEARLGSQCGVMSARGRRGVERRASAGEAAGV
jgi:UDP-galactopyranose mutase